MELLVCTSPCCSTWRSRTSSPRNSPKNVEARVDVADSGSSSSPFLYARNELKTELARFTLPRETVNRGEDGTSAVGLASKDCFSAWCDTSDRLDMKEAVRRLRSRFAGCESSLGLWMLVRAVRELRPKILLRLSLDMPSDHEGARRPAAPRRDYRMQRPVTTGRRTAHVRARFAAGGRRGAAGGGYHNRGCSRRSANRGCAWDQGRGYAGTAAVLEASGAGVCGRRLAGGLRALVVILRCRDCAHCIASDRSVPASEGLGGVVCRKRRAGHGPNHKTALQRVPMAAGQLRRADQHEIKVEPLQTRAGGGWWSPGCW